MVFGFISAFIHSPTHFVCVYVCVCVQMHTHICAHVWRPEINTNCLLQSVSNFVLGTGSLLEPAAHQFGQWLASQSQEPFCLPLLGTGIIEAIYHFNY